MFGRNIRLYPRRLLFIVGLLGAGLLWPVTSTYAQDNGRKVRLAVMSHPQRGGVSNERAAWLQRLVHWALSQQAGLKVLPQDEVRKKLTEVNANISAKDRARIRVLKTFLAKARKLYQIRRYRFTLKALGIAEKVAAKVRVYLKDPKLIRDLYLYRAMAYMGLRQGLKTREFVMRTIQFDPSYSPSSSTAPTTFLNYYNVIRRWLLRRPKYQFSVKTNPPGAKVYLNLSYKGTTPLTMTVVQGKHLLRLEKSGYSTWERLANFDPSKLRNRRTVNANISLKRDPRALSLNDLPLFAKGADIDDNIMDKLDQVCARLQIKELFVVSPRRSGKFYALKIATYKDKSRKIDYKQIAIGQTRQRHRVRILAFARGTGQLLAPQPRPSPVVRRRTQPPIVAVRPRRTDTPPPVIRSPRRRVRVQPRPRPSRVASNPYDNTPRDITPRTIPPRKEPPKAGTPVHRTWWFWTVTIGATVAVGATVAIIMSQTGPPPSATLIITTENPAATGGN